MFRLWNSDSHLIKRQQKNRLLKVPTFSGLIVGTTGRISNLFIQVLNALREFANHNPEDMVI
jgi:hypothetical protein